jgi:flagellar basal-body rod protein FlgC
MDMFRSMDVSGSGMTAQRKWMDVSAENLANARTTRAANGQPYRAKSVAFSQVLESAGADRPGVVVEGGVQVSGIQEDQSPFIQVHDPGHPDADVNGDVLMPNVNPVLEMTNLSAASRAYEANIAAFNAGKGMFLKALEIGKGQ